MRARFEQMSSLERVLLVRERSRYNRNPWMPPNVQKNKSCRQVLVRNTPYSLQAL